MGKAKNAKQHFGAETFYADFGVRVKTHVGYVR